MYKLQWKKYIKSIHSSRNIPWNEHNTSLTVAVGSTIYEHPQCSTYSIRNCFSLHATLHHLAPGLLIHHLSSPPSSSTLISRAQTPPQQHWRASRQGCPGTSGARGSVKEKPSGGASDQRTTDSSSSSCPWNGEQKGLTCMPRLQTLKLFKLISPETSENMVRTHAPALDNKLAELTSTCHAVYWGTIELSHFVV